jgi:glycosyltransferase involved in cell wall biosynthesis
MTQRKVLLVDPSLYTAPYDAALTQGLLGAGVEPMWATRPVREGDREEIPPACTDPFFYRCVDQASWLPAALRPLAKGCAHLAGTARLLRKIRRERPMLVHVQWVVAPLLDVVAMALIRRWCPLVLTVHDTVPYNGQEMSWLQRLGHGLPAKLAHRVIVHTRSGRQTLERHGVPPERICVIPHGPLSLSVSAPRPATRDPRWTVVLFGEIKPYKGLDLLIDAVAALPISLRRQLRVVVAGRPRMDLAPLLSRIASLGLHEEFDLRLRRLSEAEMAALFAEADSFVFPYRQIDASGVYYLVKSLGKWLIASRVGVFAEDMTSAALGILIPPADVPALAQALRHAIVERPHGSEPGSHPSWTDIGRITSALYDEARAEFDAQRLPRQRGAWRG